MVMVVLSPTLPSPSCCAHCEKSPAAVECITEGLLFCPSCSTSLHSKKARSHHVLRNLRTCDECETATACVECPQCGGSGEPPLYFCSNCSSVLHSRKARAHHEVRPVCGSTVEGLQEHVDGQGNEKRRIKRCKRDADAEKGAATSTDSQDSHTEDLQVHGNGITRGGSHRRPLQERDLHSNHSAGCLHSEKLIKKKVLHSHQNYENKIEHRSTCQSNQRSLHPDPSKSPLISQRQRGNLLRSLQSQANQGSSSSQEDEDEDDLSSEEDTSADDETYGTKKYRKGSVMLEAFLVDADDLIEECADKDTMSEPHQDHAEEGLLGRIRKILELGLHPDTPDFEAQQALKNAQRLLTKHNLQQADVMEGRLKANHALKGGMRMVELRSKKSNSCGRVEHWIPLLAMTVAKHFDTQYFYQKRSSLQVVFYGIKQNADCAGYAFAATFNRVTKLSSEFVPSKDGKVKAGKVQSTYSRISRMSYRNGLVEGLFETVKSSKQSHPKPNFANGTDKTHTSSGIDVKSDPFDSDTESGPPQWESELCSSEDDNGKENCRWERPQQGEQRRSAALSAIILHSQKVGEDFLKEKKIKVKTRKMDGPVIWDGDAFLKGKKDSKAINIGQRGITAKARKA